MEEFKERLSRIDFFKDYYLRSNNFLLRYLLAADFKLEKAEKIIEVYLEVQEKYRTHLTRTMTFPGDFSDKFSTYVGGKDYQGRPIAMIPHCGRWNIKECIQNGREEMFVQYVLKVALTFEEMVLKRDSDYGILVGDVSNMAYGNYFHKRTLEVVLHLISMVEKIAPGIIQKVYFVNAPKIWVSVFNALRALITINADIYVMDSNEKKWKAALREVIPEDGICPEFGGTCKDLVTV
jgi:hypothetical protein